MRRLAFALLLAAAVAGADEVVVRVVAGDDPVGNVAVRVEKAEGLVRFERAAFGRDALTDDAGQAVVEAPRGARIVVYAPGYALEAGLVEGAVVDFSLRRERTFHGSVVDRAGKPVAGATVRLETLLNRPAEMVERSDAQGRFRFYSLWLDDFRLSFEAKGFLGGSSDLLTERMNGVRVSLWRPARAAGVVVDEKSKPLAGVVLRVRNRGEWRRAVSGAAGEWSIDDLHPGEVLVVPADPHEGNPRTVQLADGEQAGEILVGVLRPARLRLRAVDEAGRPLAETWLGEIGTTDREGRVEIVVAAGRRGALDLTPEGYAPILRSYGPERPGSDVDLGDLVFLVSPPIEVRVRTPDGEPVAKGALEEFAVRDGKALCDRTGFLRLEVDGYPQLNISVERPGPVDVVLPAPLWLDGVVKLASGEPAKGAHVASFLAQGVADETGRFRLGPLAAGEAEVSATLGGVSAHVTVTVGEGDLEIALPPERRVELLRGRLMRGTDPVRRFRVNEVPFADEQGRFEVQIDRAARDWVEILAGGVRHLIELPPAGEPLNVALPGGALAVTLEGGATGVEVELVRGALVVSRARTGADGIARLDDLPAGDYLVRADRYEPAEAKVTADGKAPIVVLTRTGIFRLEVHLGEGTLAGKRADRDGRVVLDLPPGERTLVFEGPRHGRLALRGNAGETRLLDLWPRTAASVRGAVAGDGTAWLVGRERRGVRVTYETAIDRGEFEFRDVLPGRYELFAGAFRRTFDVPAAAKVLVAFELGTMRLRNRVLLAGGRPAQGARVELRRNGHVLVTTRTDPSGRFGFDGLSEDRYVVHASMPGTAPDSVELTLDEEGVRPDGWTLTLGAPDPQRMRLLGPDGRAVPYTTLDVDGAEVATDGLGSFELVRLPATVNLQLAGYAPLWNEVVRRPADLVLRFPATLVVRAPAGTEVLLRVDGRPWSPYRPLFDRRHGLAPDALRTGADGQLVLRTLPLGPVEIARGGDEPRFRTVGLRTGVTTTVEIEAE